jgi:hypothetical protein
LRGELSLIGHVMMDDVPARPHQRSPLVMVLPRSFVAVVAVYEHEIQRAFDVDLLTSHVPVSWESPPQVTFCKSRLAQSQAPLANTLEVLPTHVPCWFSRLGPAKAIKPTDVKQMVAAAKKDLEERTDKDGNVKEVVALALME